MTEGNLHTRIEDSEVTFIDTLLTGPEVEAKVESDVKNLLLFIGIKATKISENSVRTPDYGNVRIAFEVTTVHPYYPRVAESAALMGAKEISFNAKPTTVIKPASLYYIDLKQSTTPEIYIGYSTARAPLKKSMRMEKM